MISVLKVSVFHCSFESFLGGGVVLVSWTEGGVEIVMLLHGLRLVQHVFGFCTFASVVVFVSRFFARFCVSMNAVHYPVTNY